MKRFQSQRINYYLFDTINTIIVRDKKIITIVLTKVSNFSLYYSSKKKLYYSYLIVLSLINSHKTVKNTEKQHEIQLTKNIKYSGQFYLIRRTRYNNSVDPLPNIP